MSEGIHLTDALIAEVTEVITRHDENTKENFFLTLQYLAAVSGVLAASFPGSTTERDDLLEQLSAFTKHVVDEQATKQQQPEAQPDSPAGRSAATDDPAMGIWKPD